MPELPEVETIARQLHPVLQGRRVQELLILDEKLRQQLRRPRRVRGQRIHGVTRQGKQVVIALGEGGERRASLWLVVHLRMTGRLIWCQGATPVKRSSGSMPAHLRAELVLKGGVVRFFDPRRFGILRLCHDLAEIAPGGIDPLARRFTVATLCHLLAAGRQEIKPWLLRQDKLEGVGNIYASEILFRARIGPRRVTGSLLLSEVQRLHTSIGAVLRKAILHCGTSFSDYQDTGGRLGGYQRYLAVYGRDEQPCRRCQTPIQRVVQQGRSTYFCPVCQIL